MNAPEPEPMVSPSEGRKPRRHGKEALPYMWPVDLQLRMVQAAVEAQLFGQTTHPVQVGRYEVKGPIGSGGMGSIVRAYEPDLQRDVALKLLRAERMGDESTRARLVQEARAMARLAHPNVAVVFEVGESDGHVFVAMELIEGRDLRAWQDEQPRAWQAALELFLQAGRGLAAAHAKGIIHRDFKPENVMVDTEGRARVVDFGLAREQAEIPTPDEDQEHEQSNEQDLRARHEHLRDTLPADLTTTGTLLGTPAYMSPEQWKGQPVDERSDQFSFCVSVWEALCGERPFASKTMGELMALVTAGQPTEARSSPAPGRVMRALRRGLAADPAERWPDMDSLLAALQPRSHRGWLAAGAVGLTAVVATIALRPGESPSDACREEQARLIDVWDAPTREAAAQGMRATGLPYADKVWASTAERLDRYADDWVARAEASCMGAQGETEAARTRYDRQQRCLEEARARLDTLGDALADPDEATVIDAAHEATRLPDPGACADDRHLASWSSEDTPQRQAQVGRAREALIRARRSLAVLDTRAGALYYETQLEQARTAATEARVAASEAGHASLEAEAALAQGRVLLKSRELPAAELALAEAMQRAEASADALTRIRARIYQIYVLGTDRNRTDEATSLGEQSRAQLDGLGPRPLLRARLESNLATAVARSREPDHDRALSLHGQAMERLREQLGDHHPAMIAARLNLGRALSYAHRLDESETELRTALDAARVVWGEDHPNTARVWSSLGLTLGMRGGRDEQTKDALMRSLQARERSLGADHQEVADALFNLGSMLRRTGAHDEAVVHLRRGLAIRRALKHGRENNLLPWLYAIGDSETSRGEHAAAREILREAMTNAERDGASPLNFARVRFSLAKATAPEDPVAARLIAQAARDDFNAANRAKNAAQVEQFLAQLP
ncbi:MAG: serine/threonine-protein kinase [Myxococcota bacterium]